MISPPTLEIAVLVLGLLILMGEAFLPNIDKRTEALTAIAGLVLVLAATFWLSPAPETAASGLWSFYAADPLAIFFKRFILITTIFVLAMMIDYAPVLRASVPGATPQAGVGEFFTLPIFACAGLMYLVS